MKKDCDSGTSRTNDHYIEKIMNLFIHDWIQMSLTFVLFSLYNIRAGAATSTQMSTKCSQEVLAGFETTLFRLFGMHPTTRQ